MLAIETSKNNAVQAAEITLNETLNDTDTTGTVSLVPVSVPYRFVLTVCNPNLISLICLSVMYSSFS